MNNLVNGIIVLAVITALTLSIIALVYPCKSKFEDSGAVPIIMNAAMEFIKIRRDKDGNKNIPYGTKFKNDNSKTLALAYDIEILSKETSSKPCNVGDTCFFDY